MRPFFSTAVSAFADGGFGLGDEIGGLAAEHPGAGADPARVDDRLRQALARTSTVAGILSRRGVGSQAWAAGDREHNRNAGA
jgi:hypothetical protein